MAPCIRELYHCREVGEDPDRLALRFHRTIIAMTLDMCRRLGEKFGLHEIAMSGGTFLNRILVTEVLPLLQKDGFTVYRNRQLPPGDGCISLGQTYHALCLTGKKEATSSCASQFRES
jgi:hydrogenase maturation protein HypF